MKLLTEQGLSHNFALKRHQTSCAKNVQSSNVVECKLLHVPNILAAAAATVLNIRHCTMLNYSCQSLMAH